MPLQDFSLEISLNYSLLIALRTARTESNNALLQNIEIRKWRYRLLTEEFVDLIKACHFDRPVFHDYGSDYALLYEELKLAQAEIGDFEYVMHLLDSERKTYLSMLHFDYDKPLTISDAPLTSFVPSQPSVLLINTVLGLRQQHETPSQLSTLVLGKAQGCVVALRACESEIEFTRTTIHGRDIVVPSLDGIQRWMTETGRQWYWRWLPRHDTGYFIPEPDAPDVGVLLAYSSNDAEKRAYFRLLTKEGS
jgi:hypothetical protein